ncbi:phospholipase D-like domain-containing protein [Streptomyces doebereineriae]|uniref:Phospholipase D-like domain-containing protein n=1 Tax=Streptomyces doebereineriae TaxID=3075528 RepID=A0ABU2VBY5_9ACTN|nr:phospholipase D-like domain-containing protein [Streptomyces sp. DSM 41640]MDT0482740.1 phospholipase D-like domain-containing protein [Streptomyces sp. DSM 41640]
MTAPHVSPPGPLPRTPLVAPLRGDRDRRIRRRLERLIGTPATEHNSLLPLRNGDEIFSAMLASIRVARRTVDLMTFVYWRGAVAREFADALAERARAGVRVRLLLDGFGSRLIERCLLATLREAGVQVAWFRKPIWLSPLKQNHRCHRKVLLVDETTAFTGGVGIAQEWAGDARHQAEWRETHFRVRGPAVDGIAAAFTQNWAECHGGLFDDRDRFTEHRPEGNAIVQVVRGSASVGWQDIKTLLRVVLESAETRIRLTTAYFAPGLDFVELLGSAARRGVEVELLVPGRYTDKAVCRAAGRRLYAGLLDAGVKIWEYQPTMMHAKVLTMDGTLSLIGSGNFNRRSLDHDEEIMLAVLDEELAATLDGHFEQDRTASKGIDPAAWPARPALQRLQECAVVPLRRFL